MKTDLRKRCIPAWKNSHWHEFSWVSTLHSWNATKNILVIEKIINFGIIPSFLVDSNLRSRKTIIQLSLPKLHINFRNSEKKKRISLHFIAANLTMMTFINQENSQKKSSTNLDIYKNIDTLKNTRNCQQFAAFLFKQFSNKLPAICSGDLEHCRQNSSFSYQIWAKYSPKTIACLTSGNDFVPFRRWNESIVGSYIAIEIFDLISSWPGQDFSTNVNVIFFSESSFLLFACHYGHQLAGSFHEVFFLNR